MTRVTTAERDNSRFQPLDYCAACLPRNSHFLFPIPPSFVNGAAPVRLQVLHTLAVCGALREVGALLEAGADPARRNGAGETPLSLVVLAGHWGCAEALARSPGGTAAVQVSACLALLY